MGRGLAVLIREHFLYILANALLMKMGAYKGDGYDQGRHSGSTLLGYTGEWRPVRTEGVITGLMCYVAIGIPSTSEISLL